MYEWQPKPGFDLTGKRAVVVGFANPAGHAISLALAEAGADVAVASATLDGDEVMAAKRAAKEIAAAGRESYSQGWDVTLPTNVQVGLKQLIKEFGPPVRPRLQRRLPIREAARSDRPTPSSLGFSRSTSTGRSTRRGRS